MRAIHSNNTSIIMSEHDSVPCIVYIGKRLKNNLDSGQFTTILHNAIPQGGMDESVKITIAPSFSEPTFMNPALKIHSDGQFWAPQWQVMESEASDEQISYRLSDKKSGLIFVWQLQVDSGTNVFTVNIGLENKGDSTLTIDQMLSTVPLTQKLNQITSFTGRWIHEFQPQHQPIPFGSVDFTNWRGRSSHDHFPGLIIGERNIDHQHGDCIAFHLGWSGNHTQRVEKSQNGLCQYQAGIAFMPGELSLKPGETFQAAALYFTYSQTGYAGIGESFQPFVRQHILNMPSDMPRPVHINTWEALYFNHDQSELDSLAAAAEEVGAERFVLDDGWFLGRRDDTAGLGDWRIDETIYPNGLHPLKATLKKHNLGFGLWFEPEMINKKSQLYQQHPDWVLELNGQRQSSGRNQWVLDITRTEVQEYLIQQISDLLGDYPVEYIKWDMNRDLLQAGDAQGHPAYYRYVLGLYAILERIRSRFPHVEIESCSSGGGRMDYGILKYTHRFWLSDCNDANERQGMQQWASLFFPAEVLGSHVGPTQSHTTSRSHALAVRVGTAMFGHLGIEWDVRQANADEKNELIKYIALHKQLRPIIHQGIRRPFSTADKNQRAFTVTHEGTTLVSIFQTAMPETSNPAPLQIPSLTPNATYVVKILIEPGHTGHLMKRKPAWMHNQTKQFSGEILMQLGLPLPILDPESLFVLQLTES